ncbi:MAG: DUF3109 family protein [Salinivirgaceae bacterium]|nr:DUF3109 family protein [Salinivirgaceae bacterium]
MMFEIDNTLVSLDLIEKKFLCNLGACRGNCCVEGDSGAPLNDDECKILEDIFETIKPRLTTEGVAAVEQQGKWIVDRDGDLVTPLVNNGPCAYAVMDGNIVKCAIEMAWQAGEVDFQKPISCHLYPVRISKVGDYDAVNYEQIELCRDAVLKGNQLGVPVYKFLKGPLVRKYGQDWYNQLCEIAEEWKNQDKEE